MANATTEASQLQLVCTWLHVLAASGWLRDLGSICLWQDGGELVKHAVMAHLDLEGQLHAAGAAELQCVTRKDLCRLLCSDLAIVQPCTMIAAQICDIVVLA